MLLSQHVQHSHSLQASIPATPGASSAKQSPVDAEHIARIGRLPLLVDAALLRNPALKRIPGMQVALIGVFDGTEGNR